MLCLATASQLRERAADTEQDARREASRATGSDKVLAGGSAGTPRSWILVGDFGHETAPRNQQCAVVALPPEAISTAIVEAISQDGGSASGFAG